MPVLGVPIESKKLKGLALIINSTNAKRSTGRDIAIGEDGAINAGLLAASILSNSNQKIKDKLNSWRLSQTKSVKKNPK